MKTILTKLTLTALFIIPSRSPGHVFQSEESAPVNENPVSIQIHMEPTHVSQGGQTKILVEISVAPKHHVYADMMDLKWVSNEGVSIDTPNISPTHLFEDKFSNKQREGVEDQGTVIAIAHFPKSMQLGAHQGKVSFTYQACSDRYCLFPKTVSVNLPYTVTH